MGDLHVSNEKRFSLGVRLLGIACLCLLLTAVISISLFGLGLFSGAMLTTAAVGMVTPCVLSGDGLVEMITGLFELIAESIGTLLEAIAEFFSSLF